MGRLAGVEIDPAAGRVLKIVVTRDGVLGLRDDAAVEVVRVTARRS